MSDSKKTPRKKATRTTKNGVKRTRKTPNAKSPDNPSPPRRRDGKPGRGPKATPHTRAEFLAHLRENGNVRRACEYINVHRKNVYKWRQEDQEFADDWDHALEDFYDDVEEVALGRAVHGTTKPIVSAGRIVTEVNEFSDHLMGIVLRGRRRRVYGNDERSREPAGKGGVLRVGGDMTDDQWDDEYGEAG